MVGTYRGKVAANHEDDCANFSGIKRRNQCRSISDSTAGLREARTSAAIFRSSNQTNYNDGGRHRGTGAEEQVSLLSDLMFVHLLVWLSHGEYVFVGLK